MTANTIHQVNVNELRLHEHCDLVPKMTPGEYQELLEDVKLVGKITQPLDVLADKRIIDGRHRYLAAIELKLLTVPVIFHSFDNEEAILHIFRTASLRRNLTASQKAILATDMSSLISRFQTLSKQAQVTGGKKSRSKVQIKLSEAKQNPEDSTTRGRLAKVVNVSPASVSTALRIKREASEEIIESVRAGDITLSGAKTLIAEDEEVQTKALQLIKSKQVKKVGEAIKRVKPYKPLFIKQWQIRDELDKLSIYLENWLKKNSTWFNSSDRFDEYTLSKIQTLRETLTKADEVIPNIITPAKPALTLPTDKVYCEQYLMRLQNLEEDLKASGVSPEASKKLSISDFKFEYVPKDDKETCAEIRDFTKRHEWLQCMPVRPTHRFICRLKSTGVLAGVIIMATPNAFTYLLGKENRNLEKLISRGACISWSPKNLASWLLTRSIKWMVQNTHYRIFTAYSDPEAGELGTIYQASNFLYLGQKSGADYLYQDPNKPKLGWFNERSFRNRSFIKQYAHNLNLNIDLWLGRDSVYWDKMPSDISKAIRAEEKRYRASCEMREVKPKHKYAFIKGKTVSETKGLLRLFEEINPTLVDLKYPKRRGV